MRQQLYLGTAPPDVEVPYNVDTYRICQLYRDELRKTWQAYQAHPMPTTCKLIIQSQSHELGDYYEVVAVFDDSDEAAASAAFWLEANGPLDWSMPAARKYGDIVGQRP